MLRLVATFRKGLLYYFYQKTAYYMRISDWSSDVCSSDLRNPVKCVSIEHKMGINGSCTCTMSFENARGWMIGKPNTGIQNMFVMMNLARIMVGYQGLGQCELATQNEIRYALDRKQGKAVNGGDVLAKIGREHGGTPGN